MLPPEYSVPWCRWHINIQDCEGSSIFIAITYTAAFFSLILLAGGLYILLHRFLHNRARHFWSFSLLSYEMFSAAVSITFGLPASLYFMIMATGIPLSRNTPLIFVLGNFCWCSGRCSLWVYLMSLMASTPTSNATIRLPSYRQSKAILQTVLIFETLSTTPFAGWAGSRLEKGDLTSYSRLLVYIYLMHSIESLALATGMWLFGGQLIHIAEEGRKELKAVGSTLDAKLGRSILKMKMLRFFKFCGGQCVSVS
ncbi:hypothetical protein HDU86_000203 [Geranomyces michiganensis]|nr:hypothetical protein HDU86_000203 [Geranomyces michiganensis]